MFQPGLFDFENRLYKIDKTGDPLAKIDEAVDWEIFRPPLTKARDRIGNPMWERKDTIPFCFSTS